MDVQQSLDWYKHRRIELEKQLAAKGSIPRHEYWRLDYFRNPYLLLVSDDELRSRFIDLHSNIMTLTEEGKIGPLVIDGKEGDLILRGWTHALEAQQSRTGGMPFDLINVANEEIQKYFASGDPIGVKMFADMPRKIDNAIVKFSKAEFLEPMRAKGSIRLCPASYYSKGSHIKSIKDLELKRSFRVPAIKEALAGKNCVAHRGLEMPIRDGAIDITIVGNDYYLFSTCHELDRRMPTDFEADAALIIRDVDRFVEQFRKAFETTFGQSYISAGPVGYYDPFRPIDLKSPEFAKHFAYKYQKEHRIVARPVEGRVEAEPLFIDIGSIEEYSEIRRA